MPGLRIERLDQIAPTFKKKPLTMEGPVVIGIPVDYRDNHRLMEMVNPRAIHLGAGRVLCACYEADLIPPNSGLLQPKLSYVCKDFYS